MAPRILFAEDKPSDVELALREMAREGLECEHRVAWNSADFCAQLEAFQPDLVITDYSMPTFTGMDALRLALADDPERPVILFTGSVNEATAVACLKAGASDYILKEHLTRLPFAVREALEARDDRRARAVAEEALRRRTDMLRRYFDRSGDPLGIVLPDGRVHQLNQTWADLLGHSPEELEGTNAFDHVATDAHDRLRQGLRTVVAQGRVEGLVLPFDSSNGRRELEITASFEDGLIHVAARDVTLRLRTERDLAQARATYEGILDSLGEAVLVADAAGRVLHVNRTALDLYGQPRAGFTGHLPEFLFPEGPVDAAAAARHVARVLAGGTLRLESRGKRGDGSLFPQEISLTRGSWFGQPVVLAVVRDVTGRKRAEEALLESRAALADISAVLAARGSEYQPNVQAITEAAGRLLQAGTVLYSRLEEDGRLSVQAHWNLPAGMELPDDPQLRLCGLVVRSGRPVQVGDLSAEALPGAQAWRGQGFDSFLGVPVKLPDGRAVGSLSVLRRGESPLEEEIRARLDLLAQALETEEAHRAAALALRHSEAQLSSVFRAAPVGILLSRERVIRELNDALCRMTGYSREELLGGTTRLFYPDEGTWDEVGDAMTRSMSAGGTGVLESVWRRKDGRTVHVLLYSTALDGDPGRGDHTTIAVDITDRVEAQRALEANEQFMRAVLESSPLGISVRDRDGRLLSHNSAWQRIWAIPDEDIRGDMARARFDFKLDERDEYSRGWWPEIQRVYREGGRLAIPEARTLGRRPGSAQWVAQHFYAIPDSQGAVDRIVVLTEDISERKRAEEAVRESEAHYRRFFENDLTADYISMADGTLLDCNPAYLRLFGFESREQALETNVTVLYPGKETRRHLLDRLQETRRLEYEEAELRDLAGNPIHVIMNVLGTYDESGTLLRMQGYLFDITKWKALQHQFHQAQKMESIGRLAGGVAHDFNNLLTVINGHVDLLRGQFMLGDPILEQLDQVAAAGERAARLTRQLLAFSRRQVLQLQPVALNEIVTDMNRMLQRMIGEDIRLLTNLEADLPPVMGDTGQLEQVVVNLVVNSRDAMPDGGSLTIGTRLVQVDEAFCQSHRPMQPGRFCLLEVRDTGTGMSPDVQARIFEPFFTTKEKGKGTGLGLATVYGIVKQIGGFIWADSEPGSGTCFRIYLPASSGRVERRLASPAAQPQFRGSETILVVEDEEMVRRLALRVLAGHGYKVLEAQDGASALRMLEQPPAGQRVDLVLTDVIMPTMGGRELADHLMKLPDPPRLLFMSGYTEESIARQGVLELGAGFIQKPFEMNALLQTVRNVLDGK